MFTLEKNPSKPNPEYFQKMLEHFGLKADDVIYFEHSPDAIQSAESVGITSYHYGSEKKDLDALKEFLDAHI